MKYLTLFLFYFNHCSLNKDSKYWTRRCLKKMK